MTLFFTLGLSVGVISIGITHFDSLSYLLKLSKSINEKDGIFAAGIIPVPNIVPDNLY